mmetsp:Transcript_10906/g.32432  ORF Transcript_10906/g.32432 Transcript_10906/m.32432 type:complete len:258 (+) Transcript_10906:1693-2466(+)|eukprot:114286-Chlamydomonas_euryale.AAC.2
MACKGIERVVDDVAEVLDHAVEQPVAEDGAKDAENAGRAHVDIACSGRDDNEPDDGAEAHAGYLVAVAHHLVLQHPHKHGHNSCNVGVQECVGRIDRGSKCRASVEAKPAKPQQGRAEHHERNVGWLLGADLGRADKEGASKRRASSAHVHDHAARKVEQAPLRDDAIGGPHHVCGWAVHDHVPNRQEEAQRGKVDAVWDGTNNDSWRDDCKHALEYKPRCRGDRVGRGPGGSADVVHQPVRCGVAKDATDAVTKRK